MSRIAKAPVVIPKNIKINLDGQNLTVEGTKGSLSFLFDSSVGFDIGETELSIIWDKNNKSSVAQAGTARAVVNNMVTGVSVGFEKKLSLVGVGYRAQAKDNVLSLSLGFSHPVDFQIPTGIVIETPSQTEIVIKGSDKQQVGQIASKIRAYRSPEPYKGKGVRYAEEQVARKEAKKK